MKLLSESNIQPQPEASTCIHLQINDDTGRNIGIFCLESLMKTALKAN